MNTIKPITDIVPHNYRQRIIVLWDKMTPQQKRELVYGFTAQKKYICNNK